MGGEAELREALELIARDRRAMLERIGVAVSAGDPEAVYRRVAAESGSPTMRERLDRAWDAAGQVHEAAVAQALDGLLRERRQAAVCGTETHDAYPMVEEAVAAQEKLDAEVCAATGTAHSPKAHFRYALRTVFGEVRAPSFALEECVAYAEEVAERLGWDRRGLGAGLAVRGARVSFVEVRAWLRAVGEVIGRARGEAYRAAWWEMWAYRHEFSGDYGRVRMAERRRSLIRTVVGAVLEGSVPGGSVPGGTVSGGTVPGGTVSGGTVPGGSVSGGTVPGGTGLDQGVREAFGLLDERFGVGDWCSLGDVAVDLLRGGVADRLREEAWCCRRMPGGGTIFAYYEAEGQLKQSLQS